MFGYEQLVRKDDPATSHLAAGQVGQFKAKHEAKIYGAIVDSGLTGATYREIARATGLEPVAVGRRLCAMERRGIIQTGGGVRDNCRIWLKA